MNILSKKYQQLFFSASIFFTFTSMCFSQVGYKWYEIGQLSQQSLNFIHEHNGYVLGDGGRIFRFDATNNSWQEEISNTTNNLRYMPAYALRVIVGDNGTVLSHFPQNYWLSIGPNNGVDFHSGLIRQINWGPNPGIFLYVVGKNGTIMRSKIIGDIEWQMINSPVNSQLNDIVWNTDAEYSIIAGNDGTILKSTDFGESWQQKYSGTTNDLNSVVFRGPDLIFIVGDNGTILKSSNRGETWQSINSGIGFDLLKVSAYTTYVSSFHFMRAVGKDGITIHSTNFGQTWRLDTIMYGQSFNSMVFNNPPSSFAVSSIGKLYQMRLDSLYLPSFPLAGNRIRNWISNTGIFNVQNFLNGNVIPGFEWPAFSGKYAFFSSGFNIIAKFNGEYRMTSASITGEYIPGYVNSSGEYDTDFRFKIYKVSQDMTSGSHWDYDNWGLMVPYGAPFVDVNNNGQFDPGIDKPGVENSAETIFLHMTDANPNSHQNWGGFGGGTLPLFAEVGVTAWSYNETHLQNVQLMKWNVKNRSNAIWEGTYFGIYSYPELGDATNDYVGCDTTLDLAYVYNATNQDGSGNGNSYGMNPPAAGITFLKTPNDLGMISFSKQFKSSHAPVLCERGPYYPYEVYNFMSGFKRDGTPWVIPNTSPPQTTKYTYSGDPESETGWTEFQGAVLNCDGSLTGQNVTTNHPGYRRFLLSTGADEFNVLPGESHTVVIAQLIARGNNHLNSVTRLKEYTDSIKYIYGTININNYTENIPDGFKLYQNFPNPFNPVTKIKFDVPRNEHVSLTVYNSLGQQVAVLVNQTLQPGSYEYTFNAGGLSSGVYFYSLSSVTFNETKRMLILK